MKILLINAPSLNVQGITSQIYPPLGILYLASYARSQGSNLDFKALDGYQENPKEIMDKIIKFGPEVLGVSFTTQAATGAYTLINEVKKRVKNIYVAAGGAHATILPGEVLVKSKADIVVVGEGEVIFSEILEQFKNGERPVSIKGTVVRDYGKIKQNPPMPPIEDLDSIPFPARDLINIKKYSGYFYKKRTLDTNLISARGCPYDCVFCSNPVWKSQKPWFRKRSPQNVVDEMEHIIHEYGITEMYDYTDELNVNMKWAKAVCDEIMKRGLDIAWKAQMKIGNSNLVDDELADKLKNSGFWMASFGIESVNDRTLKGIQKKQTLSQIERVLAVMKRNNIRCFGFFITFNIWEEDGKLCYETKEDCLNTLSYIKKWINEKKLYSFGWGMATPYPGCQLYKIAVKHNLIAKDDIEKWELFDSTANFVMALPNISQKEWLQVMNAGKRLQAKLLLTSGAFRLSNIPLYFKKVLYLIKKNMEKNVLSCLK